MGDSENAGTYHHQKYPKGSLMLKKLDSGELSGIVKSFDTQSGVYSVQWSDNTEDLLTEDLVRKFIMDSPDTDILKQKWIPFKG